MPRYFIYCRKSTESEDRQVLSIDSQRDELVRLAERAGFEIAELLTEAKSAKAPGRPVFTSMMTRLARGEAQGVLCWKLDRLARNPVDGGSLIWAMKTHGLEMITPTQTFRPQDDNKILLYIEFGMAEKYIDDLSRNVKRGNRAKLERGGWPHTAPPGYLNDRLVKTIVKDPHRFALIRRAWDLLLSGSYSVMKVLETLNHDWGYRTQRGFRMARTSLYSVFANPFYYGFMASTQGDYIGRHELMISEDEFWRAQQILGARGRPRPRHRTFAYTGLIRCGECGCMITAEAKVNRYGSSYTYYHCTRKRPCTQPSVEVRDLERQIAEYLGRLTIPPVFLEWAFAYLEETEAHECQGREVVEKSLHGAIAAAEHQLATLTQMRTRDLITDEEFVAERSRLQTDLVPLREKRHQTSSDSWSATDLTAETFILAARAGEWFLAGDLQTRREIVEAIGSNLFVKGKILTFEAKTPFRLIEGGLDGLQEDPAGIEPSGTRFTMRDFVDVETQKNKLWALMDDVRTSLRNGVDSESLPTRRKASAPRVPFAERIKQLLRTFGVLRDAA